jgi:hypothetical protein
MAEAIQNDLAFDRVVVLDAGQHHEFTVEAFLALPLALRVRYVLGGNLQFFRGSAPIDRVKALGQLRHQTARTNGH